MFDAPKIPIVYGCSGEQNSDATHEWAKHREPPSPAMDGFHGGVKAHRPAPEKGCALRRRSTVHNLLNFPLATQPRYGKNGSRMHGED